MIIKTGIIKGNEFNEGYRNFTTVGTVSINNGIATGFSSSNYLVLDYNIDFSDIWEGTCKVKTAETIDNQRMIYSAGSGDTNNTRFGYSLYTWSNGGFGFNCTANGTSWSITSQSNPAVSGNTIYWLKFGWDKTKYYIKLSTDGKTFNDYAATNNTNPIYRIANYDTIGVWRQGSVTCPWVGEIYLDEFILKDKNRTFTLGMDRPSIGSSQVTCKEFMEI